jgi:glycosyltransferase involved in cell wall biosynthesis
VASSSSDAANRLSATAAPHHGQLTSGPSGIRLGTPCPFPCGAGLLLAAIIGDVPASQSADSADPAPRADVVMALQFWPRGGSAQVVRYLAPEIVRAGWPLSLVTGSLGGPGDDGYAPEFFAPLPVTAVDYSAAMDSWRQGGDPFAADIPLHPSYEDREGAPDRVYADVDDADFERQVAAWSRALVAGGLETARVAHLHHLTPVSEAVQRLRPELPVVVTLHGTEMNMLEAINRADPVAERWRYARQWADRMRAWAAGADWVIVDSPTDKTRSLGLFDIAAERISVEAPGVDSQRFHPQHPSVEERLTLLRRWLVDDPRGWDESGVVGSVRYTEADLAAFADPDVPVLIFVGRFTEQKRVPLLMRAYARARREYGLRAPLLVWGGFPVEFEGEHPVSVVRSEGIEGVFFTGWRGHEELPTGLGCADVFVSPSVNEAFGQVFIEAMACGLPVIAGASGGPLSFVNDVPGAPNGWLVASDDEADLAKALADSTTGTQAAGERMKRSANGLAQVRARFSWSAAARQVVSVYEEVVR